MARMILSILTGLLALGALTWLGAFGELQTAAAASNGGIRADGKLDFISSEGRVLASIDIEIADTPRARATGLMGRRGLDDSVGMLFVHEKVAPRRFWMRNTPTSLDIVFVSENHRVINIAANTTPLSDTVYSSKGPALYVVEVRAGFCVRHGIGEGTLIRWRRKVNPSP
jgi:uncharacterized membrane protein (UPF0127 family)